MVFVTWMWQLKWRQLLEWPLLNSKMKKKHLSCLFFQPGRRTSILVHVSYRLSQKFYTRFNLKTCVILWWLSKKLCIKMDSLYQIHSKMLHGTKVIIFILWQLKKYWFIMKDPRLALSTSNMEVMSSNPSQATSFLFFPPKWLLSCYATFLS